MTKLEKAQEKVDKTLVVTKKVVAVNDGEAPLYHEIIFEDGSTMTIRGNLDEDIEEITYELQYSPDFLFIRRSRWLNGGKLRQSALAQKEWRYGGDAQYSYFTATEEEAKAVMTAKLKEQIKIYKKFAKDNGLIL